MRVWLYFSTYSYWSNGKQMACYGSWVLKDIFALMMFPLMGKMNHFYYLRELSAALDTRYAWLTLTVFALYNNMASNET